MRYNIYKIQFTSESKKQFDSYTGKLKNQIADKLEKLAENPHLGIPLQGPLKGLLSYHVGKLRIIYKIKKEEIIIIVLSISYRRESYRFRIR